LISADSRQLLISGRVQVTVGIQGLFIPHEFYVINCLYQNALVGLDFLQATRCQLNLMNATASFFDDLLTVPLQQKSFLSKTITAVSHFTIPPRSEALPLVICLALTMIKPHLAMNQRHCLVARAVVQRKMQKITCRILNYTDQPKTIRKGSPIAVCERAEVLSESKNTRREKSQKNKASALEPNASMKGKREFLTKLGIKLNRQNMDGKIFTQFLDL